MMAKSLCIIICCLIVATFVVSIYADSTDEINLSSNASNNSTEEFNVSLSKELNNKAYSLQESGEFEEALSVVNQSIEEYPNSHYSWGTKASILMHLNRYDEALTAINQALELNASDSTLINMKKTIEEKINGGNDSAEGVDESYSNELNYKAYTLQESGEYDEALSVADQAIEQNPNNNQAWGTKASILMHLNRYDEALIAINEALQISPNHPTYLNMKKTIEKNL